MGRVITSVPSKDFSDEVLVEILVPAEADTVMPLQVSHNLDILAKIFLASLYFEYRLRPLVFDLDNYNSECVFCLDINSQKTGEFFENF